MLLEVEGGHQPIDYPKAVNAPMNDPLLVYHMLIIRLLIYVLPYAKANVLVLSILFSNLFNVILFLLH